jgi:hypothetical protein
MTEAAVSFAGNLTDDPELRHTKLRHSVTFTACCPAIQGLVIADEASPFALRSTRNRPRTAMRRGRR